MSHCLSSQSIVAPFLTVNVHMYRAMNGLRDDNCDAPFSQ